jgi:hypothetical protein
VGRLVAARLEACAASRLCARACRGNRAGSLGDRGRQDSIAQRLARSTGIILIDLPLWMHFWLAAERQLAWAGGRLDGPPAAAAEMPPTRELFRTMAEVDQSWLPDIRSMCALAELEGKAVTRLGSIEAIDAFMQQA